MNNKPSQVEIFYQFLIVGAISFGGGVVAYLRDLLVQNKQWMDDKEFLELTSISNTLPGLNATNIAILAGDRLGGTLGSILAMTAMCLPAFIFMTISGFIYGQHADHPLMDAALKGVAAAATGMIAATWFNIGKKSLRGFYDAFFVLASVVLINHFHLGVPLTLLCVGGLAIFVFRPRAPKETQKEESEAWIRSLH
jgi:chromate transporter